MKNLNKNLILASLVLVTAFAAAQNAQAYRQAGFYELSYNGPILEENSMTPVIYYLDPAEAFVGETGKKINVIGANFVYGAKVVWNGSPRTTIYANSNRLIVELNKYDLAYPGQYGIKVVNPTYVNNLSNTKYFTVIPNAPTSGTVSGTNETNGSVAQTTATTKAANVAKSTTSTSGQVAGASTNTNSGSNLSASAGNANSSFIPRTLTGWLVLCVLILLGVILFRKLWVTEHEKHMPLKHA